MYRCENCGAQTPSGQRRITYATYRPKTYRNKTYNEAKKNTTGKEIEKEIKLCKRCNAETVTDTAQ